MDDDDEDWTEQEYEDQYFLLVCFHNLKLYDAHFVIKHFKKQHTEHNKRNKRASDEDDETNMKTTYGDVIATP